MRNPNHKRTYYVTWMSRTGIRTREFHSLPQARRFALSVNTAGLEITSAAA